jgi:hypothetical protein
MKFNKMSEDRERKVRVLANAYLAYLMGLSTDNLELLIATRKLTLLEAAVMEKTHGA